MVDCSQAKASATLPDSHLKTNPILRLMGRIRYQILVGLLVSVALPMLVRQSLFSAPIYLTTQFATIFGGAAAFLLGYFVYRRLLIFPGIASGGYAITSMTATFGLLTVVLVLLRIDYSRWQLSSCYLLSITVLLFIHLKIERSRNIVLAYLPGGQTDMLPIIPHVVWRRIDRLDERLEGEAHSVVVDLHHAHDAKWESAIAQWVLAGIPVYDTRLALEQLTGRVQIKHIYENTLGSLNPNTVLLKAKSIVDFVVALLLIIILLPLMIVVGLAIRYDSRGPAIFRQQRVGFRAKPFIVYKFRTMHVIAEDGDDEQARKQAMTQNDDVRITRVGRILRRTRLDELPQLFNIVRGEMSLIGPRPEAQSLSRWYEQEIPYYHYRHIIKPGLTGWAQVNQGHVTDVDAIREKLHLDFYYVKNYSFWLDILIMLRTIAIVVTGHGAR